MPASTIVETHGDYVLHRMTSAGHGPVFWPLLGPFFGDRAVHAELEGPIYDTTAHTWIIALHGADVAGWGAVTTEGDPAWLAASYVVMGHRRHGLHRRLIAHRLDVAREAGATRVRAATNGSAARALQAAGFSSYRQHGPRWTYYEMTLREE